MRRPEGFGLAFYLVAVLVVLGVLGGAVYAIHRDGYKAGRADEAAERDRADREAEAKAERRRIAAAEEIRQADAKAYAAGAAAESYRVEWERARNEAIRSKRRLASFKCPAPAPGPGVQGPAPGDDGDVTFSDSFVVLWDSAWTGEDGKPVFVDPGGSIKTAGGSGPVNPADVLQNHKENAGRCSADRRQMRRLIETIKTLRRRYSDTDAR